MLWLAHASVRPHRSGTDIDLHDWRRRLREAERELAAQPWMRVELVVDGRAVVFDFLGHGQAWVATRRLNDHLLSVKARGVSLDAVALTRLEDAEPYLAGSRAFRAASRRRHAH